MSWKCKPSAVTIVAVVDYNCHCCCCHCYCCSDDDDDGGGGYGGDFDESAAGAADDSMNPLRGIVATADCRFCWTDFGLIHPRVAAAAAADVGGGVVVVK